MASQLTQIIADSTCDLSQELIAKHHIEIVPLHVILGEESFSDGVDIQSQDVIAYCERTKTTPKTAAPSLAEIMERFKPHVEEGREVVFLSISASMSACYQNAVLAAQEFPEAKIECVDAKNLSTGIGLLVLEAAEMAEQGLAAKEIADRLQGIIPRVRASFVVDTMAYLYRGGRCSALQAFGANMLNIKPQIVVTDGVMHPTEKYRGNIKRSSKKYAAHVLEHIDRIDPKRVFVTYSPSEREEVDGVRSVVEGTGHFHEILETQAGCVVTSHCGPGTIGVLYIEKS